MRSFARLSGDSLRPRSIRVARREARPARAQQATEMAFTDAAAADDQNVFCVHRFPVRSKRRRVPPRLQAVPSVNFL